MAQLAATRSQRKRKLAEMDDDTKFTYYGIATTSFHWQLIELKDNVVKTSKWITGHARSKGDKERISVVIAHIVNVLNKCKKNYDDGVGKASE